MLLDISTMMNTVASLIISEPTSVKFYFIFFLHIRHPHGKSKQLVPVFQAKRSETSYSPEILRTCVKMSVDPPLCVGVTLSLVTVHVRNRGNSN
jgi:hypothetical protein